MKRTIKFAIILLTTLLIFFLLFLKIDFGEFLLNFKKAGIGILILTLIISIVFNLFISSIKLQNIVHLFNCNLNFKRAFLVRAASLPIRSISPFKAGEVINAYYLKKHHNLALGKGIAVIIIDRFFSLTSLLFFILIALFYMKEYYILLILLCLFLISLFSLRFFKSNEKIKDILEYSKVFRVKEISYIFFISVLLQLSKFINAILLLKALGISVPFLLIILYVSLSILISSVPITIFGLGTREAAIIFFFTQYASYELLLVFSLLFSFVEFIFPTIIGLIFVNKFLRRTFR